MKNTILFILIFVTKLQFGQVWCPPGANWHYRDISLLNYKDGISEHRFTKTVTINNITCCEIARSFTGVVGAVGNPVITMTFNPYFTYENNKVYYLFNSSTNSFDTLCNFNANIGDKWGVHFVAACSYQPKLTVVDTGHVFINNQSLKKIVVSVSPSIFDTIVEKIGGINLYLGAYYKCIADGPVMPRFICYQDNNFPLYMRSNVSSCLYDVGLDEFTNENSISVFPNPSTDQFFINSLDRNMVFNRMTLTNIFGQKILEYSDFPANKGIPINTLSRGIYFIRLDYKKYSRTLKLIKN